MEREFWLALLDLDSATRAEVVIKAAAKNIAQHNREGIELDIVLQQAANSLKLEMARQRGDREYLNRYASFLSEDGVEERFLHGYRI